jgi:phosphopantothenoylcysteine synthetase/decarboxylase
MNLLVTAGNTQVLIDRVRCLTNIFTGRTGAGIAVCACERGHRGTLLTSHPEVVPLLRPPESWQGRWQVVNYCTFEELAALMERHIQSGNYDAVVHCAAVSDYLAGGVYAPAAGTSFSPDDGVWHGTSGPPRLLDRAAAKVKSDEPELWLRLVRAPKLVDRIRRDWGFQGQLVKFKLEVGLGESQLLDVAERSRVQSAANWMVANTLEGAAEWAYLGPFADGYRKVTRHELAGRLIEALEGARK